jgi:hypothetical protein
MSTRSVTADEEQDDEQNNHDERDDAEGLYPTRCARGTSGIGRGLGHRRGTT